MIGVHVHELLLQAAVSLLFKVLGVFVRSFALSGLSCYSIILQLLNDSNLGRIQRLIIGQICQTSSVLKLQILTHVVLSFLALHSV